MIDCSDLLAMPVSDCPQAEAFIAELEALGLSYHFDDGAEDCLFRNRLVTLDEAQEIDRKVEACYAAWKASGADFDKDNPIGHLLKVAGFETS